MAKRVVIWCVSLALMLLAVSCSTFVDAHRQKHEMMAGYMTGQNHFVSHTLEKKLQEPHWYNSSVVGSGDEVMWRLEAGAYHFHLNEFDQCLEDLGQAERLMAEYDERATVSVRDAAAETAAFFTNPNALPYRGYARDRVLLPVFKALSYLGKGDRAGFRVELFKLREAQDKIAQKYEKQFEEADRELAKQREENAEAAGSSDSNRVLGNSQNSALANSMAEVTRVAHKAYGRFLNPMAIFLSGYGYALDNDYQNSLVDFQRLYKAMPNHPVVQQYYVTALKAAKRSVPAALSRVPALASSLGEGNVLVIFANGRSAALREEAMFVPIFLPGYDTIVPSAFPVCEYYPVPYTTLQIQAGGAAMNTATVADMDAIISQEYSASTIRTMARLILNIAVKETAFYLAVKAAREAHPLAEFMVMMSAWTYKVATNTADTRSWEILPKEFQICHFPIPEDRQVVVAPDGYNPVTFTISPTARNAVIYVSTPSNIPEAASYKLFELQHN